MNNSNFSDYLTKAETRYQNNYQSLKSLVVAYPYCQNLRYLLLDKSRTEQQGDYQRHLRTTAVYAIDRTHLFNLMHMPLQEEEEHEVLELLPISAWEVLPAQQNIPVVQELAKEITPPPPPTLKYENKELEKDDEISFSVEKNPVIKQAVATSTNFPDCADAWSFVNAFIASTNPIDVAALFETKQMAKSNTILLPPIFASHDVSSQVLQIQIETQEFKVKEKSEDANFEANAALDAFISEKLEHLVLQQEVERAKENIPFEIVNEQDMTKATESASQEVTYHLSFSNWLKQLKAPTLRHQAAPFLKPHILERDTEDQDKEEKSHKKKKKQKKMLKKLLEVKKQAQSRARWGLSREEMVIVMAEESVEDDKEIVSETLAKILEGQGQKQKAIEMYERLNLLFPKKSIFFAAEIERLKNI